MRYFLSNQQMTALKVRGERLQIAMPIPSQFPTEPSQKQLTEFFASYLGGIEPDWIRSVEETEICVSPFGGSWTDVRFPPIVTEKDLHMVVPVVVGTLCEKPEPRNGTQPIRWPGNVSQMMGELPETRLDHNGWTAKVEDRRLVIRNPAGKIVIQCNAGRESILKEFLVLASKSPAKELIGAAS